MRQQVRCHGDDRRFDAIAALFAERFAGRVRFVADVAGGQGLLSRILRKRYNVESEVIDPRGRTLKGVPSRPERFDPANAAYFDLVIGLHPDEALRSVVVASLVGPTILVPCCNYWSSRRMGIKEMCAEIAAWYRLQGVSFETIDLEFSGPYSRSFVTLPPRVGLSPDRLMMLEFSSVPVKRDEDEAKLDVGACPRHRRAKPRRNRA
jgi:hypothetical protein